MTTIEMEPDPLYDKVMTYFRRRRYLEGNRVVNCDVQYDAKVDVVLANIEKDSSAKYLVSYNSVFEDLSEAEQQLIQFKGWLAEITEVQCQNELLSIMMPLVCHLYVESLGTEYSPDSLKFLKKFSEPYLSDGWIQLLEHLFSLHSIDDLKKYPFADKFRKNKVFVRVSPLTVILLRKCLASKNLDIIIQTLHRWFDFDIIPDGTHIEEELTSCGLPILGKNKSDMPRGTLVTDPALLDLINVITLEREKEAPPPPLYMFTAQSTKGLVCGTVTNDCNFAVTGGIDSALRIYALGDNELLPCMSLGPDNTTYRLLYSPKRTLEKQVWSLTGHKEAIYGVAFLKDNDYLISGSFDHTMRLWHVSEKKCSAVYRGHSSPIWAVAASPLANYVATGSHDKTARVWSIDRTFPVRIMAGHNYGVTCLAFHPNGSYLATGSPDKTVRLWSVPDGNLVRVLGSEEGLGPLKTLAFSPNGDYVASAGDDKYVWVWDLAGGSIALKLCGATTSIVCVSWSNDCYSVSALTTDGTILNWALNTNPIVCVTVGPKKYITGCKTPLSLQYNNKNSLVALCSAF